jgi:hypothetical protein
MAHAGVYTGWRHWLHLPHGRQLALFAAALGLALVATWGLSRMIFHDRGLPMPAPVPTVNVPIAAPLTAPAAAPAAAAEVRTHQTVITIEEPIVIRGRAQKRARSAP